MQTLGQHLAPVGADPVQQNINRLCPELQGFGQMLAHIAGAEQAPRVPQVLPGKRTGLP